MADQLKNRSDSQLDVDIENFLQELPPLNPALIQGNCNIAPLPHTETQGEMPAAVETDSAAQ